MTENYMADVAKLLCVELGEEFKIEGHEPSRYKLTEEGMMLKGVCGWERVRMDLEMVLNGQYKIKKLPWKPKVGDVYYRPHDYHAAFSEAVTDFWRDTVNDFALKEAGMIFKTKEECEAALPALRKKYLGGESNE